MNRVVVNNDTVDQFVSEQTRSGNDVRWDGWSLVFFKANPNGFNDKNGAYRNGKWGVQARVEVDDDGHWRIPVKYVASRRKGS